LDSKAVPTTRAIGSAVNIASRLCDMAAGGKILITQRAHLDVETRMQVHSLGVVELKGVKNSVGVYSIDILENSAG
jgi:class 3 adenylate cyclase